MFEKIDSMGEAVGQDDAARIVNVNYGHDGSGKLYSYQDNGQHRTGDEVVVSVTHPKSGKKYKTLAKIRSTHGSGTEGAQNTQDFLQNGGSKGGGAIKIKTVDGGDQSQLPGYARFKNEASPTKAWRDSSAQKKADATFRRLNSLGL